MTDITVPAKEIRWQSALTAIHAAVEQAETLDVRISVAVVDSGGNRLACVRMNGSPFHCMDIAEDKALTAASFRIATSDWDEVVADNQNLYLGLMRRERLVMFPGGFPLLIDGYCAGGIGVSGATEDQDEQCARAGLAALGLANLSCRYPSQTAAPNSEIS